ncbi:ComEA family DNA-binding protein [Acerihabitans sp. TG2]|uniref:ComEA family DNA-binding protein n=1 Tax=Acerihabitans sp. TG2 TaxID=3096008 RepID=UPI002B238CCC|nr:ComEA family DNA-binding protein [Acerihabitans sp. TG2]MEA9390808.1 ComEA family DNA-binding protein [Acerihabitans sp. TG2]
MKRKGMLSVRLALLTGLILLSGGAYSAGHSEGHSEGETVPGDSSLAIGAQALEQDNTNKPSGTETGDKGAEYLTDDSATTLNFGNIPVDSGLRDGIGGSAPADGVSNPDSLGKNGSDADNGGSSETGSIGDTGNGTESVSDAGDSNGSGSQTDIDSVGSDGHSSDSALANVGEDEVALTINGTQAKERAADKKDQNTQTDDFDKDKVNVNSATADELVDGLKGIGPKKAQAIIAYRDKNGPFTNIDQLKEVKGIGPATLARNKDRLEL